MRTESHLPSRKDSCYDDDSALVAVPTTTGDGGSYHSRTDCYSDFYCYSNG